jgi:hypothetical protein
MSADTKQSDAERIEALERQVGELTNRLEAHLGAKATRHIDDQDAVKQAIRLLLKRAVASSSIDQAMTSTYGILPH